MIRWSNKLTPLLRQVSPLTQQQVEERLDLLNRLYDQGQNLAQNWEQSSLNNDKQIYLKRLKQALKSCEHLLQDLLDLKTALAVDHISAFGEEQRISETTSGALEIFNALPDVGGFSEGFNKLENEYYRLQSEDEVKQLSL